jgi:hypothetical protein
MPPVRFSTDASGPVREAMLTENVPSELPGVPARSVRRATARRASNRRATARNRRRDPEASIIEFLARHPGSTAGDLAKRLNLDPGAVATRLTQLAKAGEIKRASHGYDWQRDLADMSAHSDADAMHPVAGGCEPAEGGVLSLPESLARA